jgi:hypothetical protein
MKPMELLLIGIAVYFWYTCCHQSQTTVAMTDAEGNPIMQTCYGIGGNAYQWPVSSGPCPMS